MKLGNCLTTTSYALVTPKGCFLRSAGREQKTRSAGFWVILCVFFIFSCDKEERFFLRQRTQVRAHKKKFF